MDTVVTFLTSIAATIVLSIIATSLAGTGLRALWRRVRRGPALAAPPDESVRLAPGPTADGDRDGAGGG